MPFTPSSSSILSSGGAVVGSDLTIDTDTITVDEAADSVGIGTTTPGAKLEVQDTTTSTANTGGSLRLSANDGAPMGDSHRLGVLEFTGAEDSSNTQTVGARIEAMTDAAWTNVENGAALYFYTTDGDASQTSVLKIDSNKKSTFSGPITAALSSSTGILIDQDYTDTDAATIVCLDVDFDKAAAASNNTMIGVNVDMDSTASTGGSSTMTGIKVTPTCTQASGTAGVFTVKGMEVVATGSSLPEQSTVRALDLVATGGDYTQGILLQTDDANGWDMKILSSATVADFCTIKVVGNGATEIKTVHGGGAAADLSLDVDGSFDVVATSASFAADVSIAEAKHFNIAAPSLPTTDHTSTGLSAQLLAGEALSAFQTVSISTTAGDVIVSDSNALGTMPVIGICGGSAISNNATGTILLNGFIRDDSWSWTAGSILYASETAGAMTHTAPTTSGALVQPLGVALTATVVLFQPSLSIVTVA